MLVKNELQDTYNLSSIEHIFKKEIQRVTSNQIVIRTNDNLIKEIDEI